MKITLKEFFDKMPINKYPEKLKFINNGSVTLRVRSIVRADHGSALVYFTASYLGRVTEDKVMDMKRFVRQYGKFELVKI